MSCLRWAGVSFEARDFIPSLSSVPSLDVAVDEGTALVRDAGMAAANLAVTSVPLARS